MKYRNIVLTSLIILTSGLPATSTTDTKNSITDRAITLPAGFKVNPKQMKENWYLNNYTNANQQNVKNSVSGRPASQRDYENRLKALSKKYGIEMPYNDVVRTYIEEYVVKNPTQVSQMLGLWPYYKSIFEKELKKNRLPDGLKFIPVACSALNPNAVAESGASGLWQFMILPATSKTRDAGVVLEVNSLVDERRDPYKSTEKAAELLQALHTSYKDWLLVIAAFNCGINNVDKAILRANNEGVNNPDFWDIYKFLPRQTRGYVPAFIAACYAMNYYSDHGITPVLTSRRPSTGTARVTKRVSLHQISEILRIDLDELKFFNPQYREFANPQSLDDQDDIPAITAIIPGNIHDYTLTLPSGQIKSYRMAEDKIAEYHKGKFARREEVQPGDIRRIVGDKDDIDENAKKGITYHTVTDGEDLRDIANRFGVDKDDLKRINHLYSDNVSIGQILEIQQKGGSGNYQPTASVSSRRSTSSSSSSSSSNYNYNSSSNSSSNYSNSYTSSNNNRNESTSSNSSRRNGADTRDVPQPRNNKASTQQQDDAARKQAEAEAAAKKKQAEAEAAAKKKRDQEIAAAKKKREQEAAKKRAAEEAARKKAAEEAARRKAAEEAARRKAAEEAKKPIIHEVKEGNNLTKLAEQYGVTIADIKAANPDLKDENIKIGQKLNIPKKGQHATASKHEERNADKQSTREQTGNNKRSRRNQVQDQDDKKETTNNRRMSARERRAKEAEEAARKKAEEAARRKAAEEAAKPITHQVKEGNNLTKLAEQYGVTIADIKAANPDLKDENIKIGQKLVIPKKNSSSRHRGSRGNVDKDADNKQAQPKRSHRQRQSQATQPKAAEKTNNAVAPKKSSRKR